VVEACAKAAAGHQRGSFSAHSGGRNRLRKTFPIKSHEYLARLKCRAPLAPCAASGFSARTPRKGHRRVAPPGCRRRCDHCTNPDVEPHLQDANSSKGANAIVVSPHPAAIKCIARRRALARSRPLNRGPLPRAANWMLAHHDRGARRTHCAQHDVGCGFLPKAENEDSSDGV